MSKRINVIFPVQPKITADVAQIHLSTIRWNTPLSVCRIVEWNRNNYDQVVRCMVANSADVGNPLSYAANADRSSARPSGNESSLRKVPFGKEIWFQSMVYQ